MGGKIRTHVSHDIRRDGFANLQRLSFSFYDYRPVGWLMARMTSDCAPLGFKDGKYIHFSQGGATQSVADPGLSSVTPSAYRSYEYDKFFVKLGTTVFHQINYLFTFSNHRQNNISLEERSFLRGIIPRVLDI